MRIGSLFAAIRRHIREVRLVRMAVDGCPDGICLAMPDGRPLLANPVMNALSLSLTGRTVTDARALWKAFRTAAENDQVRDGSDSGDLLLLRMPDGTVRQLRRQRIGFAGEEAVQYVASDITELYGERERLRDGIAQMAGLRERQRRLLAGIVQANLEKELLHAKLSIHDDIGRMLLATTAALADGFAGERGEELLAGWLGIARGMRTASVWEDETPSSARDELVDVARMIGCEVHFRGELPKERMACLLLFSAVREALTNAVRHAGAHELYVDIRDGGPAYAARISSDGEKPVEGPLREGSGLGSLRDRLEREGASLEVIEDGGVVLVVEIPKL